MKFFLLLLIPSLVCGAQAPYQRDPKATGEAAVKQELNRIWNDVRSHETEILKLQNHIATQDATIEEVRSEWEKEKKNETSAKAKGSLEEEVASLKKNNQILTDAINSDKEAIARLQTSLQKQEDNLAHIQKALKSIMGAVGVSSDSSADGIYTVKSGDSLGEIAHRNHTTADQLKKLNQLKNDRIFVGQKIKLP